MKITHEEIETLRELLAALDDVSVSYGFDQGHTDTLRSVVDLLAEADPKDPLHIRARIAAGALGLGTDRLDLAVAVFGWGSDEANGSLIGLVGSSISPDGVTVAIYVDGDQVSEIETLTESLVDALEDKCASLILEAHDMESQP